MKYSVFIEGAKITFDDSADFLVCNPRMIVADCGEKICAIAKSDATPSSWCQRNIDINNYTAYKGHYAFYRQNDWVAGSETLNTVSSERLYELMFNTLPTRFLEEHEIAGREKFLERIAEKVDVLFKEVVDQIDSYGDREFLCMDPAACIVLDRQVVFSPYLIYDFAPIEGFICGETGLEFITKIHAFLLTGKIFQDENWEDELPEEIKDLYFVVKSAGNYGFGGELDGAVKYYNEIKNRNFARQREIKKARGIFKSNDIIESFQMEEGLRTAIKGQDPEEVKNRFVDMLRNYWSEAANKPSGIITDEPKDYEKYKDLVQKAAIVRNDSSMTSILLQDFDYRNLFAKQEKEFKHFDYQRETVQNSLRRNGRAILADQVGMGKTIEAGMIIAEHAARKLFDSILFVVPNRLVPQWISEMKMFGLEIEERSAQQFVEECEIERYKNPPSLWRTVSSDRLYKSILIWGELSREQKREEIRSWWNTDTKSDSNANYCSTTINEFDEKGDFDWTKLKKQEPPHHFGTKKNKLNQEFFGKGNENHNRWIMKETEFSKLKLNIFEQYETSAEYEIYRKKGLPCPALELKYEVGMVVVDEIHKIFNKEGGTSMQEAKIAMKPYDRSFSTYASISDNYHNIKHIMTSIKDSVECRALFLSATPLRNRIADLFPLAKLLIADEVKGCHSDSDFIELMSGSKDKNDKLETMRQHLYQMLAQGNSIDDNLKRLAGFYNKLTFRNDRNKLTENDQRQIVIKKTSVPMYFCSQETIDEYPYFYEIYNNDSMPVYYDAKLDTSGSYAFRTGVEDWYDENLGSDNLSCIEANVVKWFQSASDASDSGTASDLRKSLVKIILNNKLSTDADDILEGISKFAFWPKESKQKDKNEKATYLEDILKSKFINGSVSAFQLQKLFALTQAEITQCTRLDEAKKGELYDFWLYRKKLNECCYQISKLENLIGVIRYHLNVQTGRNGKRVGTYGPDGQPLGEKVVIFDDTRNAITVQKLFKARVWKEGSHSLGNIYRLNTSTIKGRAKSADSDDDGEDEGLNETELTKNKGLVGEFSQGESGNIMLCDSLSAEGLNLQSAHILINYSISSDLNEMEQRIGRIDRIGQTQPMTIYSFAHVGDLDSYLLYWMDHELNLFSEWNGEIMSAISMAMEDTNVVQDYDKPAANDPYVVQHAKAMTRFNMAINKKIGITDGAGFTKVTDTLWRRFYWVKPRNNEVTTAYLVKKFNLTDNELPHSLGGCDEYGESYIDNMSFESEWKRRTANIMQSYSLLNQFDKAIDYADEHGDEEVDTLD